MDALRPPAVAWKMGRDTNNRVISVPCFPDPSRPLLYKEKHQLYSGHLNDALQLLLSTARKQREGSVATALSVFSFGSSQSECTDRPTGKGDTSHFTTVLSLQIWLATPSNSLRYFVIMTHLSYFVYSLSSEVPPGTRLFREFILVQQRLLVLHL